MQGFWTGALRGAVVGAAGLAAVSIVAPPPRGPVVSDAPPADVARPAAVPSVAAIEIDAERPVTARQDARRPEPQPLGMTGPRAADTAPGGRPEVGTAPVPAALPALAAVPSGFAPDDSADRATRAPAAPSGPAATPAGAASVGPIGPLTVPAQQADRDDPVRADARPAGPAPSVGLDPVQPVLPEGGAMTSGFGAAPSRASAVAGWPSDMKRPDTD